MSTESAPDRYRRRRYWPAAVLVLVLGIGAGVVWIQALKPDPTLSTACNNPGATPVAASSPSPTSTALLQAPSSGARPTSSAGSGSRSSSDTRPSAGLSAASTGSARVTTVLGAFTDANTLAAVRPADPSTITLRVFNASTVRGQAKAMTDQLRATGFLSIGTGANDPLYPAQDLRCWGEIRYGAAGAATARTVMMVAPCAQLVQDNRIDDSVDLALGARFTLTPVSAAVKAELTTIRNAATPPAVIEGQTAAAKPLPAIPALPDRSGCPS